MDQRKENRPKKRRPGWAALLAAGAGALFWAVWGPAFPQAAWGLLREGARGLWRVLVFLGP